ncbi:DUF2391 family protein [Phorcysia thermohydrogeniphila]|uniref:Putative membrane protein n=1 Tax=Phorcysia thermohydrogeniphila TaxID=936138 RepID=A0A4R1G4E6_9BACT|nr:DUF2391 family protein [Phorcysia thermohydrogeniphila]TCK02524.1 putative membrane protein [Phorcysia thermohydrogeniphila]
MDRKEINELRQEIESIDSRLKEIAETLSVSKKNFNFNDFIQEITGAVILAFPFAANADIWEISKNMTFYHAAFTFIATVLGLFIFIRYANVGNWKTQNLAGFIPLRLLTSLIISLVISALSLLILGIYPGIINTFSWFIKTVILVTVFSVIGSIGLDAAK